MTKDHLKGNEPVEMKQVELDSDITGGLWNIETVGDLVAWAQRICDAVPEEFRKNSTVDFEDGYVRVGYRRPLTDLDRQVEERAHREAEAKRNANEYAQFQKLKAKYEPE